MKGNKFENIILQGGDERNLANTGNDQMDIDEMSMSKQKVRRYWQNTAYRRYFSLWVMLIVPVWLILVFVLVVLCSFNICVLDNSVLNTLLATTTANILGLAYIVLRGMFPQKQE